LYQKEKEKKRENSPSAHVLLLRLVDRFRRIRGLLSAISGEVPVELERRRRRRRKGERSALLLFPSRKKKKKRVEN